MAPRGGPEAATAPLNGRPGGVQQRPPRPSACEGLSRAAAADPRHDDGVGVAHSLEDEGIRPAVRANHLLDDGLVEPFEGSLRALVQPVLADELLQVAAPIPGASCRSIVVLPPGSLSASILAMGAVPVAVASAATVAVTVAVPVSVPVPVMVVAAAAPSVSSVA
eukprot:CAMPEP_0171268040 /NCGR_PEP_ID=MMETSP0790-20130122/59464_1 /TAXON_ID=2925 /ORGANISM="Alexandrium catenella, Strain OF101" /LENGTH=164 /DNA_ID=CAMNT_0011736785 /DNA_START=81 /DNA_END=571 /DNA_ORIENTATION=+